jgi:hypothetical protein
LITRLEVRMEDAQEELGEEERAAESREQFKE